MTPFYQPSRQAFSSSQNMQQPSFGGGFGGGFQMPQQNFGGFGGGYGFQQPQYGGFGGGYGGGYGGGFGFQQPQYGGFGGGFQPQYGGFGGGFQQQGFGFNPMLGGIGGLGFNPMMGPQFGMPMQGFNPYQQQMQQSAQQQDQRLAPTQQFNPYQQQDGPGSGMGGFGGMGAAAAQAQRIPFEEQQQQFKTQVDALPEYQALQNAQRALEGSDAFKSIQQKQRELAQQMQAAQPQRQPMYGGLGSLGFNPMMGAQFGMPMQQFGRYGDQSRGASQQRSLTSGMTPQQIALFREQEKQNTLSKQAASGSPIQEFLLRKQSGGLPTGFLDDVDTKTFLGLKGDLTPEQQTQRDQLANTLISKFADAGQLSDYEKQQFSTQEGRYDWNYGRKPLGAPR